MEIVPELRLSTPEATVLPESDGPLVATIRAEIEDSGPITFARFMELALYHPERGYYATRDDRGSRTGDFLTAPETHPIFGRVVGRQLHEMWELSGRPTPYRLLEYGAGSGVLALDVLRGLVADGSELQKALRYRPVEVSVERSESIQRRLADDGFGANVERDGAAGSGCVLANEFLDALPVHRVLEREGRLQEVFVGWRDGHFVELPETPSSQALAERLAAEGVRLADGQTAEICLGLDAWAADTAVRLERGFMLLIDYGYPAAELYAPTRGGGTLRAYTRQRAHADPFVAIGRQDLTAHVDVTAVTTALAARGWRAVGETRLADFLVALGVEDLLGSIRADPATSPAEYLALRSGLVRMLDPRALGNFRVMAFGRGVPEGPVLRGFAGRRWVSTSPTR